MSLLTICQALARNVGLEVPDAIVSSPVRQWQEALQFANEVGAELHRRADWPFLVNEWTASGTGGEVSFSMPSDFSRLQRGIAAAYGGTPILPLSQIEWQGLTHYEGAPRYFLRSGNDVDFWPYLSATETASIYYITGNWCDGGESFALDTDETLFDEELFAMGLIVRWRRQKGMPYTDEEAEFEAMLADQAKFADGGRR